MKNFLLLIQLASTVEILEISSSRDEVSLDDIRKFTYEVKRQYLYHEKTDFDLASSSLSFSVRRLTHTLEGSDKLTSGMSTLVYGHHYRLMGGDLLVPKPVWLTICEAKYVHMSNCIPDSFIAQHCKLSTISKEEVMGAFGLNKVTLAPEYKQLEKMANLFGYTIN